MASCAWVALSRSEPNCAKAASSRYCARSRRRRPATSFMAFICAEPPTRDTELPTLMAGRMPELKRSRLQEDLAVGDRDDVGRDVGRDVAGLGLDDRQRGEAAAALLVGELGGALQQAAVQVEDVARVGLAARRAAQQQRDLAVGRGVLGEVVVDAERVPAVVAEVLAHGAAGVGAMYRKGAGSEAVAETTMVYSIAPYSSSVLHHLRDRRALLADGDVDADDALALLVDDGVDGDRRSCRSGGRR